MTSVLYLFIIPIFNLHWHVNRLTVLIFYRANYASAVYAVIVGLSVRPSVCPSVCHKSELYKDG